MELNDFIATKEDSTTIHVEIVSLLEGRDEVKKHFQPKTKDQRLKTKDHRPK
jgi:hypothetical protein